VLKAVTIDPRTIDVDVGQIAEALREYDRAIFSEGWTKTLSAKLSKIAVFTGLGFAADFVLGAHAPVYAPDQRFQQEG
jgi:hypothetical protein